MCSGTEKCAFYTYYPEEDNLFHEICILLTELLPPFEPSDSALSGPANCTSSECFFFGVNGDRLDSLMVTSASAEVNVNVVGFCKVTILAVGGGGRGDCGGGGSGYLQYQKIYLSSGVTSFHAETGYAAQASSVTYNGTYGTSIVANPGQLGECSDPYAGGYGFSGGGQYTLGSDSGYQGGSDGSAGGGSLGGSGTGKDISEYVFTTWTLTPGDGGSPGACGTNHRNQCGGGGGGVLVDGAGPDTTRPELRGKGFGGGGNGASNANDGLQGIILLEISSA